jgi:hypothetical protein
VSLVPYQEPTNARLMRIEARFWRLKGYQIRQLIAVHCMRLLRKVLSPALPKGVRVVAGPTQDVANFLCGNPGCQAVACYERGALKWARVEVTGWVGCFSCPLCKHQMWVSVEQWDAAVKKTQGNQ